MTLSRRETIAGIGTAAIASGVPLDLFAAPRGIDPVFRHGVASGDPDATSVVLWSRVAASGQVQVRWELAEDAAFARIAASGQFPTGPERDFTVKPLARGLKPGTRYWYRFSLGDAVSPVGRTRTLPDGRLDRLGLALASCSNYAFGYFNAYDAIARDPAVDYVLHTGDYIYEYGAKEWGAATARRLGRIHEPAHEIVSLEDYRTRHAQYKSDAGSQAMLAAHPLLACWDDHESTNNPWTGGAQNHQSEREGDWAMRRAAAIRAYYEWMPVRDPDAGADPAAFWRSYAFGDLATLVTLETRHTGRGEQVDYRKFAGGIRTKSDAERFERDVLGDPARAMLAPAMLDFFRERMAGSVRQGQLWRLVGNAIPMARTRVPDVVGLGIIENPEGRSGAIEAARELAWKGKFDLPFYTDTWDGYPAARERFYETARAAGASDLLVLTGDSHSFWANRLYDAQSTPMGVELGTAGITSPGDFLESGFAPAIARQLDLAFAKHNREVRWTDNFHQGYVRLVLSRATASADFVAMSTVTARRYRTRVIRSEPIVRRMGSLAFAGDGLASADQRLRFGDRRNAALAIDPVKLHDHVDH